MTARRYEQNSNKPLIKSFSSCPVYPVYIYFCNTENCSVQNSATESNRRKEEAERSKGKQKTAGFPASHCA